MAEPTVSALSPDVRALVHAWTRFAIDLFHGLGSGEENLVVSPSSVATLALRPELVGLLAEAFRAGLRQVDFRRDPEGARRAINGLVAEQTAGKIPELFEAGAIDTDSRLVLTNAIYLEAGWQVPFDPSDTRPEPFHRLRSGTAAATEGTTGATPTGGGTTEVDMLHRQARLGYARGDGWSAVELPYRGGRLVMDAIVPDDGSFRSFQVGLEAGRLGELLASLRPREVRLALPKFTFDSALDLRGPLQALGMRTAFSEAADFSGITEDQDLQVDRVVQQAHIEVDERGTTAAAATGATIRLVSAVMPTSPVELRADRPFLFAVRDRASGALLFLGRVTDPSA